MKKLAGFSLLETIITIVILAIVAVSGGTILQNQFQASFVSRDILEMTARSNHTLERMSREIREARDTSDISQAQTQTFAFIDIRGNRITYSLSGANLMRNTQVILTGVTGLTFSYLDNSYATLAIPIADTSQIACIMVAITTSQNNLTSTINTQICPRNFSL